MTVHLTAKNVSDGTLPSTVMVGIMNAVFVDKVPSYSLDQGTDSDNFFLREKDGAGNPDHENLDIYYSLGLSGLPVSDVKVKVYKGESSTPEVTLDGEKDAGGSYKTGDGLHITWTPEIDNLSEDHPGFYRLQLVVSVEGQGSAVLETAIADADSSTPGWQCPQDCLAVHDLHWKHRPVVFVHADETGTPTSLAEFIANSTLNTVAPNTANHFYDLFSDGMATVGDWADLTANQRAVFTSDAGTRTIYHSANRTEAVNHLFLQYWMFENFSRRPFGIGWLPPTVSPDVQHEGDVEYCHITICLKDTGAPALKAKWLFPFAATASQHYYAQTLKWDLINGGAASNAHSQEYVQHVNNRLAIYIAHGAHATYFASDPDIAVEGGTLGTQIQYAATPGISGYDITSPAQTFSAYSLLHVDCCLLGTFQGHWGFFDPDDTGTFSNNGPPGPNNRSANTAGGGQLNLRAHPKELHNLSRKTSQQTEMAIQ